MKEFCSEKIIFDKMTAVRTGNFSLIGLLYMHRWCLHWLINSSDFIGDFGKLPFPSYLGKYFMKIGKISAIYMKLGKLRPFLDWERLPYKALKMAK